MKPSDRQRPAPGELVLDHVSHFVPDLDAAAAVFENLGFFVTARSVHRSADGPVGASARCVMLEEGYIELRESMARFVGVHLACFGTPDAEGEHRRLAAHGFAPEPIADLRFKVVRPAAGHMPEGRIQFVEQLTPRAIRTAKNLAHRNAVTGLKALYVVAEDLADTAARWAEFTAKLPRREGDMVMLETSRGRVHIAEARVLQGVLGDVPPAPALAGYALACRHPEALAERCRQQGLEVRATAAGQAISLPGSLGGSWLV